MLRISWEYKQYNHILMTLCKSTMWSVMRRGGIQMAMVVAAAFKMLVFMILVEMIVGWWCGWFWGRRWRWGSGGDDIGGSGGDDFTGGVEGDVGAVVEVSESGGIGDFVGSGAEWVAGVILREVVGRWRRWFWGKWWGGDIGDFEGSGGGSGGGDFEGSGGEWVAEVKLGLVGYDLGDDSSGDG